MRACKGARFAIDVGTAHALSGTNQLKVGSGIAVLPDRHPERTLYPALNLDSTSAHGPQPSQ